MHAELAAVFEGHRKFDAELRPGARRRRSRRDVQRTIGRLEKASRPTARSCPEPSAADAARAARRSRRRAALSTNDYHIHRRPGEVMIVRWLAGDAGRDVLRAPPGPLRRGPDAASARTSGRRTSGSRTRRRSRTSRRSTRIEVKMADRYLRDVDPQAQACSSSPRRRPTRWTSLHLCDYVMGVARRRGRRRRLRPAGRADRAGPGVVLQALLAPRRASRAWSGCASSRSCRSRTRWFR